MRHNHFATSLFELHHRRLGYVYVFFFPFRSRRFFQAIREIYSTDAIKAKEMATERRKNGTIEMSAARMASMMDEAGEGGVGGDVPMVKVRSIQDVSCVMCHVSCMQNSSQCCERRFLPPMIIFLSGFCVSAGEEG